jgi:predicted amidohydrolase
LEYQEKEAMNNGAKFKLSLIQMLVEGGKKEANLSRAEILIRKAASDGAQVVLLPEALDHGWTHPVCKDQVDEIPNGESFERLKKSAIENQVFVCAGIIEREKDSIYNSAVFIDPTGKLLLKHRKINELEIAHPYYELGNRIEVCQTPLGTVGLMICADAFAPNYYIGRALGYMGADIILSPASWAVPHDHDNKATPYGSPWQNIYASLAQDFDCWIAGVSNVGKIQDGPWKDRLCIGCSRIVAPGGKEILVGPYGMEAETTLSVDIELQPRSAKSVQALWKKKGSNPLQTKNPSLVSE